MQCCAERSGLTSEKRAWALQAIEWHYWHVLLRLISPSKNWLFIISPLFQFLSQWHFKSPVEWRTMSAKGCQAGRLHQIRSHRSSWSLKHYWIMGVELWSGSAAFILLSNLMCQKKLDQRSVLSSSCMSGRWDQQQCKLLHISCFWENELEAHSMTCSVWVYLWESLLVTNWAKQWQIPWHHMPAKTLTSRPAGGSENL